MRGKEKTVSVNYHLYNFDFEKLDVYQEALDFANDVFKITNGFRREIQYSLGDQFRRAALSICNNIAEGSQKTTRGRKQFYHYALDSARECIPMISLSLKQKEISPDVEMQLRGRCLKICNMVYRLIRSVDDKG